MHALSGLSSLTETTHSCGDSWVAVAAILSFTIQIHLGSLDNKKMPCVTLIYITANLKKKNLLSKKLTYLGWHCFLWIEPISRTVTIHKCLHHVPCVYLMTLFFFYFVLLINQNKSCMLPISNQNKIPHWAISFFLYSYSYFAFLVEQNVLIDFYCNNVNGINDDFIW